MYHVCGFICYLYVELKLKIYTRSLSNQALKPAHPSLLSFRFWPWVYSLGLVICYSTSGTLLDVSEACGLDEMWSSEEPRGLAWHQSSGGSIPLEDAVDGSTGQTNVTRIALCHMASQASASTPCQLPIWVGWSIIRTISENCWFELATVWRQILGTDHLS